ncbi:MAG: MFS transporter [Acidobacteria bacterium]|nr:MFS transporter [Acidobacteriota bacterium]
MSADNPTGILARIGLRTKIQRAWAMYDWANSAMVTIVISTIYQFFFLSYAASDLTSDVAAVRFGLATSIGLAIIAILAPILGAMADQAAVKKRMLGTFMGIGAASVALMFFIQQGAWFFALVLFVLANIGANGSFVFYDSLLPHVAPSKEMDKVSTAGYALGYIGGGLILAICGAVYKNPGWIGIPGGNDVLPSVASLPFRLSFVAVAVWWVLFAIPLFRHVPEPAIRPLRDEGFSGGVVRLAFKRLMRTLHELRKYRNAFLLLLAFLIYNDGIGTIIRMSALYGESIGIDRGAMILAYTLVQFIGIPFAFLFGGLAGRIGTKRAIYLGLVVYAFISIFAYFITTTAHFFILAILTAMVQGGTQALSRSLFGSMIPPKKSGEFFGLFAVFEKFAGILGPSLITLMTATTGSLRNAIPSVFLFFLVGGVLLVFVNVEEGQRKIRESEE